MDVLLLLAVLAVALVGAVVGGAIRAGRGDADRTTRRRLDAVVGPPAPLRAVGRAPTVRAFVPNEGDDGDAA